ncbi:GNAT family N-acetyltransferase [Nakamurella lactea]|uniref:GNAT family N-acetyltransferase n=1 Tax=Nakamurella lactea TaxID=459515 RepID=UPI000407DF30|nr:GNAT family protein [Nakamurella lactea]
MSLTLRPIARADVHRIHEWASQESASRYQTWGPNTFAQTEAFVDAAAAAWFAPDAPARTWCAVLPGQGVVGNGGLTSISPHCQEISYIVHTDLWGRGLATEIALLLVEFAFHQPGTERVQATCDPRNTASAAVLTRIGMSYEGTLRHTMLIRDGWRDSRMYSVLTHEWPSDPSRLHRISTEPT